MWWLITGSAMAWWDPAWAQRAWVEVDNASGTVDLDGFVLPLFIDDTILDSASFQTNAEDLRVIAADDLTELPYDIELWAGAVGSRIVWVRMPLVQAGNPEDGFWIYYDNPAAPRGENQNATWDDRWVGVYHLNGDALDSSGELRNGTEMGNGGGPSPVAGWFGQAQSFDGNDDHIELPDESAFDLINGFSVLAWIQPGPWPTISTGIVTKGNDAWRLQRNGDAETLELAGDDELNVNFDVGGAIEVRQDPPAWHFAVGTFDNLALHLYVDGDLDDEAPLIGPLSNEGEDVWIGSNADAIDRLFAGAIDEVRVTSAVLDADWIDAEWRAANDEMVHWCTPLRQDEDDDADGSLCFDDCDDADPTVDGNDLDLDGFSTCAGDCDDGSAALTPADADLDGLTSCDGDCNDADAAMNQADADADGATSCDGDCNDADAAANLEDADADGYSTCDGDCNDAEGGVYPGAEDIGGNGIDEDCDGDDTPEDPGPTGGTDDGGTDGGGEDTDDGTISVSGEGGCGCDAGGAPTGALAAVLGAALALARRTRHRHDRRV
jgi:MYXO-CTERM domain-containing protein